MYVIPACEVAASWPQAVFVNFIMAVQDTVHLLKTELGLVQTSHGTAKAHSHSTQYM